jgi:hypothetical protein
MVHHGVAAQRKKFQPNPAFLISSRRDRQNQESIELSPGCPICHTSPRFLFHILARPVCVFSFPWANRVVICMGRI